MSLTTTISSKQLAYIQTPCIELFFDSATSMSGLVRGGAEPIQACIEPVCFSSFNGRHFSEQTAECYGVLLNCCIVRMSPTLSRLAKS